MAQQIALTVQSSVTIGSWKDTFAPGQQTITITNAQAHCPIVVVGTSEEDLSLGDITSGNEGYVILQNLDNTNYVTYGPKSGGAMIAFGKIKPGELAILRLKPSVTMRWQADTAAVSVGVRAYAN